MGDLLQVPAFDKTHGIITLILTIFLSGLGLLIGGIIAGHKNTIIIGAICLVLTLIGIGWILALIWAILILIKSL